MPTVTPSSNPLRKWEKKLRNAKTEEQKEKAESMLRALRPKVKGTNDTTINESKPVLTEDQLIQKAIKENKKDKKFYEEKREGDKKRSLERDQRRSEILSGKRKREGEKKKDLEEEKKQYEKYKEEHGEHNKRIQSHMEHAVKFAEQEGEKGETDCSTQEQQKEN